MKAFEYELTLQNVQRTLNKRVSYITDAAGIRVVREMMVSGGQQSDGSTAVTTARRVCYLKRTDTLRYSLASKNRLKPEN